MEVILGREPQTRKLSVTRDGKVQFAGAPGSVPMDVSRQHVKLISKGENEWEIKNLNDLNVTYVNGMAVEKKEITENDKIELGKSRYALTWEVIRGPKVEYVDIKPLKSVWDSYKESLDEIEERKKNIGLMSSIPMTFTMAGTIISAITPPEFRAFTLSMTAVALLLMVYGLYKRKTDTTKEETEELKKNMYKRYVCPKCGKFLGMHEYDLLIGQIEACPKCKAKFKK